MKISVFETEGWEQDCFGALARQHDIEFDSRPLDAAVAAEHADADVISTFIGSTVDEEALGRFDALRLIATRSTGVDHVDLGWCQDHGVAVANVPAYGAQTVAEHAFALLLSIARNLGRAAGSSASQPNLRELRGFDLHGRTLGVIGTGDIGRHAARVGRGFAMTVLANDVAPDRDAACDIGFNYVDQEELLERSDIVTVHVPANEATHHLLSFQELSRIKPGSVLINTSRGSVVDTRALLRALGEGRIAAAGLDVVEHETALRQPEQLVDHLVDDDADCDGLAAEQALLRHPNVVVTPHLAFNTDEAVRRIVSTTAENIAAFLDDHPTNLVER